MYPTMRCGVSNGGGWRHWSSRLHEEIEGLATLKFYNRISGKRAGTHKIMGSSIICWSDWQNRTR